MQLFIGGACAGKREVVATRFPEAYWHRLEASQSLSRCQQALSSDTPLVITGLIDWLASVTTKPDSDTLRQQWREELAQLCERADTLNAGLIIIASEVGRGIVPMQPEQRRLRDINGWFIQDATARADHVWYVRHGLVMELK